MGIVSVYEGVSQVDCAQLVSGSVTYTCLTWAAAPNDLGPRRVEYAIFTRGEGGQVVFLAGGTVANAVGSYVDCPRVLAVEAEGLFFCHWADSDVVAGSSDLYRARFLVSDLAGGWINMSSVGLHASNLYDHAPILGDGDNEFVISYRTAAGTITTERYGSGWAWTVDAVWSVTNAGLTIADRVLAVHADAADDVVLISYQSASTLFTISRDAGAGTLNATAETFPDLLDGDMQFTAVSHKRIGTDTYLVDCEAAADDDIATAGVHLYARIYGYRAITGTTANVLHEAQWLRNIHKDTRLWTRASGTTGQLEAFCGVSFKSIADGQEFDQMYGYVIKLCIEELAGANAAGVIRPVPVSAMMTGSYDSRPHGMSPATTDVSIGKRMNHVSSVVGPPHHTLGPDVKTVLYAHTRWGRLAASEDDSATELQPVEAGIAYEIFYHEPPWTIRRDASEPTQPDTPAWRGLTRTHCLPVQTPAGTIFTGGITSTYDGYQVTELGFLWTAEILAASPVGAGGSMDVAEEYTWMVNALWVDARGNVHRGPPSRPASADVVVNGFARIRIRCQNLTTKDDQRRYPLAQRVYFEVWRTYSVSGSLVTEGAGDLETYLFRSEFGGDTSGFFIHDLPASDADEFSILIDVGRPNSIVQYNELAPWQLNLDTLQWTPPPPIPHVPLNVACLWQNRLFGVDQQGLLRWSEEILPRGSDLMKPYFIDTNVMRLAGIDEPTALVPYENDLGLLARDSVHAIAGDPGAGGSGNTFQLRVLGTGFGCIEARSVTSFPGGFTFQSMKRLHVVTRGSGIEDIGGPVEDTIRAGGNVRGVTYLEDRDELRFLYAGTPGTGPLAVRPRQARYNIRSGLWTTRTLPLGAGVSSSRLNEPMHGCTWRLGGDTVDIVLLQGSLLKERLSTDTVYSDEGSAATNAVLLDVTTGWITMGLDTTKRFPEIGIMTERVNAGPLTIQSWYDHDGSFDSDTGASEYTLTVASPAPAFIRFRPTPSKCRAIKLRIFEPSGAASTENVRLVALVIHWMLKSQRQGSRNNAA